MRRHTKPRKLQPVVPLEDRLAPATFTATTVQDLDTAGVNLATGQLPGGQVTLRSAILAANATAGADTVVAPAGTYLLTVAGAEEDAGVTGDLDVLDVLTLELAGATIDAAGLGDRVLDVPDPMGVVIVNGGVIVNGTHVAPAGTDAAGGGVRSNGTLALNAVTVVGNAAVGPDGVVGSSSAGSAFGGGVASFGTLTVTGGVISNNTATGGDGVENGERGGSAFGGGVHASFSGSTQITAARITGNAATGGTAFGFGEFNTGGDARGGGLSLDGSAAVVAGSRIDNNQARGGAGAQFAAGGEATGGGLSVGASTAVVQDSTFDANLAVGGDGSGDATNGGLGGDAGGGGVEFNVFLGTAAFENSTVSGNTAVGGAGTLGAGNASRGQAVGGGVRLSGFSSTSLIGSVTITNNEVVAGGGDDAVATRGGGLGSTAFSGGPSDSVRGSVIAGNRGPIDPDVSPLTGGQVVPYVSLGSNVIGVADPASGFADGVNGDQVGSAAAPLDPLLTPLGFFGGDPNALVHGLNPGSPARDKGNAGTLTTDQRGPGFPRVVNGTADAGAFEVQVPATLTQTVTGTPVAGQPFTVTGSVTDPRFQPTGTVTLILNGAPAGTGALDAVGNVSFTATVPTAGPFTVSIAYAGDAAYLPAASTASTFVALAATTTAASANPNPAFVNRPVTFFATVTPASAGVPTGTVQFFLNGTAFGAPVAIDAAGNAVLPTPAGFAVGSYQVFAAYSGDAAFGPSSSAPVTLVVTPIPTTTTVAVDPNPAFANQPVTLSAAVASTAGGTPTGAVQFFANGTVITGAVPLDATGTAAVQLPFAVGSYQITAVYSGDPTFTTSTSAPVALVVNTIPTTTTVTAAPNPVLATDPVTFTATVVGDVGGSPTGGTVTFAVDGSPVATVAVVNGQAAFTLAAGLPVGDGAYSILAAYSGDPAFQGSASIPATLTVNPVPTRTTLAVVPATGFEDTAFTLTAAVAFDTSTAVNPAILNGTVNFFNGTTPLGSAAVTNGVATLTRSGLPVGANALSAVFVPATNDLTGSTGTATVTVAARPAIREIFAASSGFGITTEVVVFDADGTELRRFRPFEDDFWCGAVVATADVTGDGVEDVIVGGAISAQPRVRIFDGTSFNLLTEFFAYAPSFVGGVSLAAGDLTGDGVAEIVTGAGLGGGPAVNVYSFANGSAQLVNSFFAYDPNLRSGVSVAVSGRLLATGPGFRAGPHVKVFRGPGTQLISSFFAFDPASRNGVNVALSFDGTRTVLTAASAAGRQPMVTTFDAFTAAQLDSDLIFEPGFLGGVTVGNVRTPTGETRTVYGTGLGGGPRVRLFAANGDVIRDFFAFDPTMRGGVYVG
jgi:hypothetical protein